MDRSHDFESFHNSLYRFALVTTPYDYANDFKALSKSDFTVMQHTAKLTAYCISIYQEIHNSPAFGDYIPVSKTDQGFTILEPIHKHNYGIPESFTNAVDLVAALRRLGKPGYANSGFEETPDYLLPVEAIRFSAQLRIRSPNLPAIESDAVPFEGILETLEQLRITHNARSFVSYVRGVEILELNAFRPIEDVKKDTEFLGLKILS